MNAESKPNPPGVKPVPPRRPAGQFRISTILSWTLVIAVVIASLNVADAIHSDYFSLNDLVGNLIFSIIFLCPACSCIPFLVDRLLDGRGALTFSRFWCIWLFFFHAIYSMLMLCLATQAFTPEWKGGKGMHWFYYTLDDAAGLTFWPIYLIGVVLYISGLSRPVRARQFPIFFLAPLILASISLWYSFAVIALNFTSYQKIFWIVPGSCGICYLLYAGIVWRNKEWTLVDVKNSIQNLSGALALFLVSILAKYPLAKTFYESLPDEPPEGCFIVTAATRGHRTIVGTWYDEKQQRLLNQQLLNFWSLEKRLKSKTPSLHWLIRRIYNRLGPIVASLIIFKWQADLVYWLLKPVEWLAVAVKNAG